MSDAKIKIRNLTTGGAWSFHADGGFDCNNGDVLEMQLENQPALDVNALVVSVIVGTKPAGDLTFPGGSTTSYSPSPPTAAFQVTAPGGAGAYSWLVRSQVNGGAAVTGADGRPDYSVNTKERIIAIRTPNASLRKGVIAETTQYSGPGGWMDAQNEEVDAVDAALGAILDGTTEYFTAGAGQVLFTLAHVPLQVKAVFIDGVAYEPTTDYTVAGANVTWTNASFSLNGERVRVDYFW